MSPPPPPSLPPSLMETKREGKAPCGRGEGKTFQQLKKRRRKRRSLSCSWFASCSRAAIVAAAAAVAMSGSTSRMITTADAAAPATSGGFGGHNHPIANLSRRLFRPEHRKRRYGWHDVYSLVYTVHEPKVSFRASFICPVSCYCIEFIIGIDGVTSTCTAIIS